MLEEPSKSGNTEINFNGYMNFTLDGSDPLKSPTAQKYKGPVVFPEQGFFQIRAVAFMTG